MRCGPIIEWSQWYSCGEEKQYKLLTNWKAYFGGYTIYGNNAHSWCILSRFHHSCFETQCSKVETYPGYTYFVEVHKCYSVSQRCSHSQISTTGIHTYHIDILEGLLYIMVTQPMITKAMWENTSSNLWAKYYCFSGGHSQQNNFLRRTAYKSIHPFIWTQRNSEKKLPWTSTRLVSVECNIVRSNVWSSMIQTMWLHMTGTRMTLRKEPLKPW